MVSAQAQHPLHDGGQPAHSEVDTNASNAPLPSVGGVLSQNSEGQGSAIQPACSMPYQEAESAAEEVAGPSRPRGRAMAGNGRGKSLRPTTSMVSTAVQRAPSPPHQSSEQHAQSPKVFRTQSVVSQTPATGSAQHPGAVDNIASVGRARAGLRGGTPASVYGQITQPVLTHPPQSNGMPSIHQPAPGLLVQPALLNGIDASAAGPSGVPHSPIVNADANTIANAWHTLQQLGIIQQLVQPVAMSPNQLHQLQHLQQPPNLAALPDAMSMAAAVGLLLPGMAGLIHGNGVMPHAAGNHRHHANGPIAPDAPLHLLMQNRNGQAPAAGLILQGVAASQNAQHAQHALGHVAPQPGYSVVGSAAGDLQVEQPQAAASPGLASPAMSLVYPSAAQAGVANATPAATQAGSVSTASPDGSNKATGAYSQAHPQQSQSHVNEVAWGPQGAALQADGFEQVLNPTASMLSAHHHPHPYQHHAAQLANGNPANTYLQHAASLTAGGAGTAVAPAVSAVGAHVVDDLANALAAARPAGGSTTRAENDNDDDDHVMQASRPAAAHPSDSCITQQQGASLHASALQQPGTRRGPARQHGEADGDNDAFDDNEGVLATSSAGGPHATGPSRPASSTAARHQSHHHHHHHHHHAAGPSNPHHAQSPAHGAYHGIQADAPIDGIDGMQQPDAAYPYACDPATSVHAQVATNEPMGAEVAMGMSAHRPSTLPAASWQQGLQPQHSGLHQSGGMPQSPPHPHHHHHHHHAEPTSSHVTHSSSPPAYSTQAVMAGIDHDHAMPGAIAMEPTPAQHGSAGSWQANGDPMSQQQSPSAQQVPEVVGPAAIPEAVASRQGSLGGAPAGSRGMSGVVVPGRQGQGPDSSLAIATAGPSTRSATISGGGGGNSPTHSNTVSWRADSQMAEASVSNSGETAVSHGAEAGGMQMSAERAYSVERASRSHVEAPHAGGMAAGQHLNHLNHQFLQHHGHIIIDHQDQAEGPHVGNNSDVEDENAGPQHAINVGSPLAGSVAGGSTVLAGPDTPTAAEPGPADPAQLTLATLAAIGSSGWHQGPHHGLPVPHAYHNQYPSAGARSTVSNSGHPQQGVDPQDHIHPDDIHEGFQEAIQQNEEPNDDVPMPHASSLVARLSGELLPEEGHRSRHRNGNASRQGGRRGRGDNWQEYHQHHHGRQHMTSNHNHDTAAGGRPGTDAGCPSIDTTASRPQDADVRGGFIQATNAQPGGSAWPVQPPEVLANGHLGGLQMQDEAIGMIGVDGTLSAVQPSSRSASRQPSVEPHGTCNGEQEASWQADGSIGSIGDAEHVGQSEHPGEEALQQPAVSGSNAAVVQDWAMSAGNGNMSVPVRAESTACGSGSSIHRPSKRKRSTGPSH